MTAIRVPTDADLAAIRQAHLAAIESFGPSAYDDAAVEAWAHTDDPPEDRYDLTTGHWIVAERADAVVGFGHLDPEAGEIVAVYVHPDHARGGVGSAILAELEGYARGAGIEEVELTASLNAVSFYEQLGYAPQGAVTHETSVGVELDCMRMTKRL